MSPSKWKNFLLEKYLHCICKRKKWMALKVFKRMKNFKTTILTTKTFFSTWVESIQIISKIFKDKWSQQFFCNTGLLIQKLRRNGAKPRLLQFCPAWRESCKIWPIDCVWLLKFLFSLAQLQFWTKFSIILDFRYWNTSKITGSVWLCLKVFEKKAKCWNTLI